MNNAGAAAIARNVCRDFHRERRPEAPVPDDIHDDRALEPGAEIERRERIDLVRRLVVALPHETREAVLLFYLEERSTHEIGALLGKSPNAIARLLKYGREKLRGDLWSEAMASRDRLKPASARVRTVIAAIKLKARND